MKLTDSFYQGCDVQKIARQLLGKVIVTRNNKILTSGMIVETEAYSYKEKGCHAYNNLRTPRTEVMFQDGGVAYVYLCYGIHHLFNIVTNRQDQAEAVLLRAVEPIDGVAMMIKRSMAKSKDRLTSGPGKLTKALGIDRSINGKPLTLNHVWLEDRGIKISKGQIVSTKRVGIDYADEDAKLLWRYYIKDNAWISRP